MLYSSGTIISLSLIHISKFYEISEKVYKAAAEQAQAQQGADGAQPGNDAGYTEANYTDCLLYTSRCV